MATKPNWTITKEKQWEQLSELRTKFYAEELPKIEREMAEITQMYISSLAMERILENATRIREILRPFDRTST